MLALAYVMNASAQTTAIGLFVAGAGLPPELLAAASSSGGVLGRMLP